MSSSHGGAALPEGPGEPDGTVDAAAAALARARSGRRPVSSPAFPSRRSATRRDPIFSGPHPDARDPLLLGPALTRVGEAAGWQVPVAIAELGQRWSEIVGADVASHTRLAGYDADTGTVTVLADSHAWASALRLLAGQIRSRIDEAIGAGVVREVAIRRGDVPVAPPRGRPAASEPN